MENSVQLNLARKWRSKNFDQLVGQDLVVKILKNSLYLNQFFPVYLFSGQRGCGKTSTARIFTAALNCDRLTDFQTSPRDFSIPCLECDSCKAIATGKHPDFIEIDAASYTGVDNVRQIIETSTLLPVMGKKKIFLIDEAHMLSKAAFNAFLKILEEPPPSVLFILATTDVEKIIETVRSRCFQLFFDPIEETKLLGHLKQVCQKESIKFDESGLKLIIKESEGSARDALNLLEQVRFSVSVLDKESVLSVLGYTSDENLDQLFLILVEKRPVQELLEFLDKINYNKIAPAYIWSRLLERFRFAVRVKNGIKVDGFDLSLDKVAYENVLFALEAFCRSELIFLKSSNKHIFLEALFLKIIVHHGHVEMSAARPAQQVSSVQELKKKDQSRSSNLNQPPEMPVQSGVNGDWQRFLAKTKSDPLVASVFAQAVFDGVKDSKLQIHFDEKNIFFKELLSDTKASWKKMLEEVFGGSIGLEYSFKEGISKASEPARTQPAPAGQAQSPAGQAPEPRAQNSAPAARKAYNTRFSRPSGGKLEEQFDISDKERWVIANKLQSKFGGTVHEVDKK